MGFGKYRDYTIAEVFIMGHHTEVISAYYNLGNVTFMPDILNELQITEEYRISKPGKDRDKCKEAITRWWKHVRETDKRPEIEKIKEWSAKTAEARKRARLKLHNSIWRPSRLQGFFHGHMRKKS